jgi:hypothetical protein
MSDDWITLIPEDPRFVPAPEKQKLACLKFREIAPSADEIEIRASETIEFHHCGANFERVLCPHCDSDVTDWWTKRMDEEYDKESGFKLLQYATPCCHATLTLHELHYEWPQGFGRFALEAMNPNLGKLKEEYKHEFERILGTPLRVIYTHI